MPARVEDTKKFKKKYIIKPGYATNTLSGVREYVPPASLMKLYKVHPQECVIVREDFMPIPGRNVGLEGLITLSPRDDGNYVLKPV